jgi:hypothetical protein
MALDEAERERTEDEAAGTGSALERKYRIAMVLYGVLAIVSWFTIGEGSVPVFGRMIEIRWIPIFVLATFAFRTVMAMQADRIRRKGSQ